MGTTAREGPMEFGKGRSCPFDGRRLSAVVRRSAVHTPHNTPSASSAVVQFPRKLAPRLDIRKPWNRSRLLARMGGGGGWSFSAKGVRPKERILSTTEED